MNLLTDYQKVHKEDFSKYGQILAVEFSPFLLSQELILIGCHTKIILGHVKIDENIIEFKNLSEFVHASKCNSLTFSPETSISILPNIIIFAAAGSDYKLRVYNSDLKEKNTCKVLSGHSDYINDIKYDPENNFIASVSDDNTAKLWETEDYKCVVTFQLSSPGRSVCWHKEEGKLMVAEKIGLIRFYNVETQSPLLSLDYGKPLSCSHWAPTNPQLVASLQQGELIIWNLSKPCNPLNNTRAFTESGGFIRFSPFGEVVAAVNNLESTLKVIHVHNNHLKLSVPITLPSNLTWHYKSSIICLGNYMTLTFWRVPAKV